MIDPFSIFQSAHQIYGKLQQDSPGVNLHVPVLEPETGDQEFMDLNVKIKKHPEPIKSGIDAGESPYQMFMQLPQEIRGDIADANKRLDTYISDIEALPVSIYGSYAKSLRILFFGETPLIARMAQALEQIILSYFKRTELMRNEFSIRVKLTYPASIVVYWQEKNVALKYDFGDKHLTISGFYDKALLDYQSAVAGLNLPVSGVQVKSDVTEDFSPSVVIIHFPDPLNERVFVYQQTADDMLDHLIQKLVILDLLDALQDVAIEEDGGIYLFFDPILEPDEIETTVGILREAYPQTTLIATPEDQDSDWWVIEVSKLSDTTVQVSNAEVGQPVEQDPEGIIAKKGQGVMQDIAQEVNVDAALQAIGNEG